MVRFGRNNNDDQYYDEEEQRELVAFKGALNEAQVNLKPHAKLVRAGLPVAKEIVTDALERHAETVKVVPKGPGWIVGLMIDGVPYPLTRLSKPRGMALVQILKLLSGLDVQNRTQPQKGGVHAELADKKYIVRVKTTPVAGGVEQLTIDIQDPTFKLDKPEDFGFPEHLKRKVREWTQQKQGVLVACGPPGSGVTSMSFCLVRCVDAFIYSVFSLRDTEGRDAIGVAPFEANPEDDFDATVMRIVRKEGDVLWVGSLNDPQLAKDVFRNADKIAFITEINAPDPPTAVAKLVATVGVEPVCQHLRAVFMQKLIRQLCPKCKEAYRPHPKLRQKLGLTSATTVLYRQFLPPDPEDEEAMQTYEPCPECNELGYRGRVAMFEMLELTDGIKEVLRTNPTPAAIAARAREEGQPTLHKDGIRLVAEGKTSLEELQRVFKARK